MKLTQVLNHFFKALIRSLGFFLLVFGLISLPDMFSEGGFTKNIFVLSLRLVNISSFIITGYGLVRLKKWSLVGIVSMIILDIIVTFNNLYLSSRLDIPQRSLELSNAVGFTIIFLILYTFRNKFFIKKSADNIQENKYLKLLEFIFIVFMVIGFSIFLHFNGKYFLYNSTDETNNTEDTLMTNSPDGTYFEETETDNFY